MITPPPSPRLVTAEMLDGLPPAARRYLERTGIVGRPWIHTVRIRQRGRFRMGQDKPWLPLEAEQVYTTDQPGFQWRARLKTSGLWLFRGVDTYKDGHGLMFGKAAHLFTIFNARGEELDQATMVRYLNEMVWFPTAFLSDYVSCREVDSSTFDATYTDRGRTVTARLHVDDAGRLTEFVTQRFREDHGAFTLDTWATPFTEYATRAGLELPVRGQAVWRLPQGDLPYADLTLTSVEYNLPIEEF